MKEIKALSLIIITLLYACNTKVSPASNTQLDSIINSNTVKKPDTVSSASDDTVSGNKIEIVDNKFSNMPLGESNFLNQDLRKYFRGTYDISKQIVKNRYTDAIDTLIYIRGGKSSVKFYKTNDKILLDSVVVMDKNFIILKKDLEIGMDKQAFLKQFRIKNTSYYADSISVIDDEGNGFVSFIFSNKKLKKIVSYSLFE